MNPMIPSRYLWENVESSDEIANQIDKICGQLNLNQKQKDTIRLGTNRLRDQANQIRSLIIYLLNDHPPEKLLPILYDAGFSRDELVSGWGFPAETIVLLESARKQMLVTSLAQQKETDKTENFVD